MSSQICLQDGRIVGEDSTEGPSMQRLYGGVQFGLDRFQLAGSRQPARMLSAGLAARQFVQPSRHLSATLSAGLATRQFQRSFGPMGIQPTRVSAGIGLDKFALAGARQPARMMSAGLAARQFVQPARHLSATLSAGLATRQFQRSFGPMGVQPAAGLARGVDLSLDNFNLSEPKAAARQTVSFHVDSGVNISAAFWSSLESETSLPFNVGDKHLLQKIFNSHLSDRRQEGDQFIPPDGSYSHVQQLRRLVMEEEAVQRERRRTFLSEAFDPESPGPLFPASWRPSASIMSREVTKGKKHNCRLLPRVEHESQADLLRQAMRQTTPSFEKVTEEGTCFRIYRLGSLEARTTQSSDGEEVIGVVFSMLSATTTTSSDLKQGGSKHRDSDEVVKISEYVEKTSRGPCCFMVLTAESGSTLVVKELEDGSLHHEESPVNLDYRRTLAKVLRSKDCRGLGWTMRAARALQNDVYGQLGQKCNLTGCQN